METLIALRGPDLLRVKGFLNVAGCRGPVLVQFVQHLAHPPVELAAWPDSEHAQPARVHHPQYLRRAQVRDLLARCARSSEPDEFQIAHAARNLREGCSQFRCRLD